MLHWRRILLVAALVGATRHCGRIVGGRAGGSGEVRGRKSEVRVPISDL